MAIVKGDYRLDSDSFQMIYETYYKKVYNYISYRINNHESTEDLVNDVFEKVIVKYETYKPERSSPEAWIIGIAKNVTVDYFRRIKRHTYVSLDVVFDIASDKQKPEEIIVKDEFRKELIRVLNTLKSKERNILSIKFSTDLNNGEIATIMGMSESNVGTIAHRAIKKLRVGLEKIEGGYNDGK